MTRESREAARHKRRVDRLVDEIGNLDMRTFQLLLRSGIEGRDDLATMTDAELLQIRGCGERTLQAIREVAPYRQPTRLEAMRRKRREASKRRDFERFKRREGFTTEETG